MDGEVDDGHLDQVDQVDINKSNSQQRVHKNLNQVDNPDDDDEEMDIEEDQNLFQIRVAKNVLEASPQAQCIITDVYSIEERRFERQQLSREPGQSVTNSQDHEHEIIVYSENKGNKFLIDLNQKRRNGVLNDFQIKLEDEGIVQAHKILLAMFPFFRDIIESCNQSMIEIKKEDVPDSTCRILDDVVSYMYGCPTRITGENIFGLLKLSSYLGLNELYEDCLINFTKVWTSAESQLKTENWKKFFQTAVQLQLDPGKELVDFILDFIAKSGLLHDFVNSEEFLQLNKDQFYRILMSERSPFKNDDSAYFAIIDWSSKKFDDLSESGKRRNETVELIKIVSNRSSQNSVGNLTCNNCTTAQVVNQQIVLPAPAPVSLPYSQDGNVETTAHLNIENGPSTSTRPVPNPKKRGRPFKNKRVENVSSTSPKLAKKRGRPYKSLPVNVVNDEQIELPSSSSSRSTFHSSPKAKSQKSGAFLDQLKNCPSTPTSSHNPKERPTVKNDSSKLEENIKTEYDSDHDDGLFDDYKTCVSVISLYDESESEPEEGELREESRLEISGEIVSENDLNASYVQANGIQIVHHFLENNFPFSPILCFMGTLKRRPCLIAYSILDSTCQIVTGLPKNFLSSGDSVLVNSGKKLYSLGWHDSSSEETFRNVESMDISLLKRFISSDRTKKVTDFWQLEPKTLKRRAFCPALITDGYLYIFGGLGSSLNDQYRHAYHSIERLDISTGLWKRNFCQMLFCREKFGVCRLKDKIFMVGGHGQNFEKGGKEYFPLDTVETFDIQTETRTQMPSMHEKRSEVCVVELHGKVYALGGIKNSTTNDKSNTVEAYDPETRKWNFVQKMNHKRSNGSVFVIDDWIYMIGGNFGEEPSMEKYNPEQDQWFLIESPNLPKSANYSSCALLKIY